MERLNQSTHVSIIICTKDRPDALARAVGSIRHSGDLGRDSEIVVVEETNSPRDIPSVRYVHLPRRGRGFGYARNVGVREAHGEVILFIDDDCEAEQGWAEALIEPFSRNPRILGVAGAVLVRDCGLIGYAENILGFPGGGLRYLHRAPRPIVTLRNCPPPRNGGRSGQPGPPLRIRSAGYPKSRAWRAGPVDTRGNSMAITNPAGSRNDRKL